MANHVPRNPRISNLVRLLVIVTVLCIALSLLLMSMIKSQRYSHPQLQTYQLKVTQDVLINLKNFYFTINPKSTPAANEGNQSHVTFPETKLILYLIISSPSNYEKRNLIRRTWRSVDFIKHWKIRHVFLLGLSGGPHDQGDLIEESNNFQDIVQGNFIDSYKNLSYKSIMGLTWASRYCPESSFIVKTDDDVFTDPYQVTDLIESMKFHRGLLAGMVSQGFSPVRIPSKKWFVSYAEYPLTLYPSYCLGFAYILSQDVVQPLLKSSQTVPYFWIEDIFVTGILRQNTNYSMNLFNIGDKYAFTDFSDFEAWSEYNMTSQMKHNEQVITQFNGSKSTLSEKSHNAVYKLPWYFVHCWGNYIGQFVQLWNFVTKSI